MGAGNVLSPGRREAPGPGFGLSCGTMDLGALRWILPLFVLAGASTAWGSEPTKIAVPDVRAVGKVDAEIVEPLSALLASEIGRREAVSVLSAADIRTMLGFEAQNQLLGCSEDQSCLAEIGGALGADLLVSSETSRLGESYFVTVVVLETSTAAAMARATEEAVGEGELVPALRRAIEKTVDPVLKHRKIQALRAAGEVSTGEAGLAATTIDPRSPGGVGSIPGESPGPLGRGALFWSALGLGVATIATGGGLLFDGNRVYGKWDDDHSSVTWDRARTAETEATLGGVLLGVGAALGVGAFLLPRPGGSPARLVVMPTPDGIYAGLTLELDL